MEVTAQPLAIAALHILEPVEQFRSASISRRNKSSPKGVYCVPKNPLPPHTTSFLGAVEAILSRFQEAKEKLQDLGVELSWRLSI
jgi:hypothetical protein